MRVIGGGGLYAGAGYTRGRVIRGGGLWANKYGNFVRKKISNHKFFFSCVHYVSRAASWQCFELPVPMYDYTSKACVKYEQFFSNLSRKYCCEKMCSF